MDLMFFVQLYDNLIVFLLKMGYKVEPGVKCFFTRAKNFCPMLVVTDLLNGGLNHRMCLLFFLLFVVVGGGESSVWYLSSCL